MSKTKNDTNRKWTSSEDYRSNYDQIFKKSKKKERKDEKIPQPSNNDDTNTGWMRY